MKLRDFNGPFLLKLFKGAGAGWMKDNALRLSAALSYYSVFSIAPLLLIAVGIAGMVFSSDPRQVTDQLKSAMGPQAGEAVSGMLKSAQTSGGASTITGFIALFFGASGVFGQLKDALNTIWSVEQKPGQGIIAMVKDRVLSFGMVLVIGFLFLISFAATTVLSMGVTWAEKHLGLPGFITGTVGIIVPLGMEVVLFALIFKMLPDAKIEWSSVWFGAAITALLFELGKQGLRIYFDKGNATSSFGAAGSLVLILLWVYYASNILFFGAEVTQSYAELSGHRIQPAKNAVSTEDPGAKAGTVSAAGGAPVKEVAVQPHALADEAPTLKVPRRETLAPILAQAAEVPHHQRRIYPTRPPTLPERVRGWVEKPLADPITELSVAVGVGVVVGIISRIAGPKGERLTPAEHFRAGSEELAEKGEKAAGKLAARVMKTVHSFLR